MLKGLRKQALGVSFLEEVHFGQPEGPMSPPAAQLANGDAHVSHLPVLSNGATKQTV